ncbi:MAG: hypothetical protein ABI417_17115 [Coleofasciculaceae cyanobacterium]
MTTRIIVRNLALIKYLLAQEDTNNPEIQKTLNSLNFVWEQHIIQVKECIELLEMVKEKEEIQGHKELASVIKNLHHLI